MDEGNYRKDKREGIGTYFHASGSKHTGYYKNGKPNGYGIYIHKNGNKYIGQFKNDKYNGEGILYESNGKVLISTLCSLTSFCNAGPLIAWKRLNTVMLKDLAKSSIKP